MVWVFKVRKRKVGVEIYLFSGGSSAHVLNLLLMWTTSACHGIVFMECRDPILVVCALSGVCKSDRECRELILRVIMAVGLNLEIWTRSQLVAVNSLGVEVPPLGIGGVEFSTSPKLAKNHGCVDAPPVGQGGFLHVVGTHIEVDDVIKSRSN